MRPEICFKTGNLVCHESHDGNRCEFCAKSIFRYKYQWLLSRYVDVPQVDLRGWGKPPPSL
eukprot:1424017-Rhodomonas_salina.1